jgi:sulfate permease, SulP family
LFLLLFMLLLAPLAAGFPLASLAAVLIVVAWTMAEPEHFIHLLRAPRGDRLVLLLTFGLTVLVDITVAVNVGVVLAALLFMHHARNRAIPPASRPGAGQCTRPGCPRVPARPPTSSSPSAGGGRLVA